MIQLRPYQEKIKSDVYNAWNCGYRNVLMILPTGGGKCFAKDTPILMYDGSIKYVQHIKKDDLLMGPDSTPRVVGSTCRGREEMFKMTPVKGDSYTFNRSHILTLRASYNYGKYRKGDLIDISINDYLKKNNTFKHLFKWTRTGVNFKCQDTEFHPYFVGLYLAEGSKHHNRITSPDEEIINYLNDEFDIKTYNNIEHYMRTWNSGKPASSLTKLREELCEEGERHIPNRYKFNSREKRLQLLAGLIDGDGYLHNNTYEIITKYNQLKDDILYLCRSLGLAAYSSVKTGKIKSLNFEGEYHRIVISGELDDIPCKVKRKQACPRNQIKSVLNTGFKLESQGEGDYYGFTIDKDERFLLGDFSIAHNTKTFTSIVIDTLAPPYNLTTAIMVHRKELVQQISLTLAGEGIYHNVIASKKDIRGIISAHRRLYKNSFYRPQSLVTVISVDTLISRQNTYKAWFPTVKQWITDEAAHVLKENKWGKAIALFPNARGLGVTATPERLDRKGLGSHADGVFDVMIEGPNTAYMIVNNYLSRYKIACPPSDYSQHLVSKSDTSDYSKKVMMQASKKSHITGDVVENYIKHANGKQAILFATDVDTAREMESKFIKVGIPAKSLDGTTPDKERLDGILDFTEKKTRVLINVDLFDEGLDVPGIECVIMARPTKSLGKYLQMIGRGLRIAEGKEYMILIDHVGNVKYHGLPCNIRKWTLDRITKRAGSKLNLLRICDNLMCNAPYDRALTECPYCGEPAIKMSRSVEGKARPTLEQVDGDLELLDPEDIRRLEQRASLENPADVGHRVQMASNSAAGIRAMKKQQERIAVQNELKEAIAIWAGREKKYYRYNDRQIHKKFYALHEKTITEALSEPAEDMRMTIEELQ